MAENITIKNVGPIQEWSIPRPENGGVVVLSGRNGTGKTTALEAIRAAAGGKADLSARDGTAKGTVEAFGATITIAGQQRRRGVADVVSLEGRGDVSTLVDPGINDPAKADAARIRAIVAITGKTLAASDFKSLVEQADWDSLIRDCGSGDPLEVAGRVKRALEGEARRHEKTYDTAIAEAQALLRQNENVDITQPSDGSQLSEAWAAERERFAKMQADVSTAQKDRMRRKELQRQLEAAKLSEADLQLAKELEQQANQEQSAIECHEKNSALILLEIQELESMLSAARNRFRGIESAVAIATSSLKATRAQSAIYCERVKRAEQIETQLADPEPPSPTLDELSEQMEKVTAAQRAMNVGANVRDALERQRLAGEANRRAKAIASRSERLREAAKGVDGVLSELVSGCCSLLRVDDGRIVTDTDRGQTLFSELSHGERWRIAILFAIATVGRGGVLVCPQEAWEGLDKDNRVEVHGLLEGSGVTLYTASCAEDAGPGVVVTAG